MAPKKPTKKRAAKAAPIDLLEELATKAKAGDRQAAQFLHCELAMRLEVGTLTEFGRALLVKMHDELAQGVDPLEALLLKTKGRGRWINRERDLHIITDVFDLLPDEWTPANLVTASEAVAKSRKFGNLSAKRIANLVRAVLKDPRTLIGENFVA